jgi:hypothetical protein
MTEQLEKCTSKNGFVAMLKLAMARAEEHILEILENKEEARRLQNANNPNLKIDKNISDLKAGDLVMLKVHQINDEFASSKLRMRQDGPFKISRVLSDGRVIKVIDPLTGQEDRVPRSYMDVSRYYSRENTDIPDDSESLDHEENPSEIDFKDPVPIDNKDANYLPIQLQEEEIAPVPAEKTITRADTKLARKEAANAESSDLDPLLAKLVLLPDRPTKVKAKATPKPKAKPKVTGKERVAKGKPKVAKANRK